MSKYRIGNGKVTIPIKEFNRINDLLYGAEKLVEEVKNGAEVIVFWSTSDGHYHAQGERAKEIIDSVKKQNTTNYNLMKRLADSKIEEIKSMSVREFKKWRKS